MEVSQYHQLQQRQFLSNGSGISGNQHQSAGWNLPVRVRVRRVRPSADCLLSSSVSVGIVSKYFLTHNTVAISARSLTLDVRLSFNKKPIILIKIHGRTP